ncbi:helix-turn-helix domain-containing protein [Listeria costaricensis]|uniref:helix-turn-helix domain-containing protein n=1 Tax=Listeria costaricensis TaxID=2026604 RepID=UPI000C06C7F6|nr:helix-turn-helix domain-containing protein [Listeria costaricensis]
MVKQDEQLIKWMYDALGTKIEYMTRRFFNQRYDMFRKCAIALIHTYYISGKESCLRNGLPLTQEQFAAYVGISRQNVNQAFAAFKQLDAFDPKHWEIKDLTQMLAIANGELDLLG